MHTSIHFQVDLALAELGIQEHFEFVHPCLRLLRTRFESGD